MEETYLQHHGILGMKWGVRRFQRKDGSLTPAGKKRYGDDDKEETSEEFEARKQKALSSGTAKDVLAFQGKLSNQELQTAISRINFEKQLKDMSEEKRKTGAQALKEVADNLENVNNVANKGMNLWNTAAKVINSLTDANLPTIGDKNKKLADAENAIKKIVKSGSLDDVYKNFGKFSVDDMKHINERFKFEDTIRGRKQKADEEARAKADKEAREKAEKEATERAKEFYSINTAEVFGEGTSKRNTGSSESKAKKSNDTIFDADWVDLGYDTPITSVTVSNRGQSFIAGLLEDKEK